MIFCAFGAICDIFWASLVAFLCVLGDFGRFLYVLGDFLQKFSSHPGARPHHVYCNLPVFERKCNFAASAMRLWKFGYGCILLEIFERVVREKSLKHNLDIIFSKCRSFIIKFFENIWEHFLVELRLKNCTYHKVCSQTTLSTQALS
jgi:hypothetical protein